MKIKLNKIGTFFKIKSTKVKKTHQSAIKLKEKFSQGFI
jgi:hypothetical protein